MHAGLEFALPIGSVGSYFRAARTDIWRLVIRCNELKDMSILLGPSTEGRVVCNIYHVVRRKTLGRPRLVILS